MSDEPPIPAPRTLAQILAEMPADERDEVEGRAAEILAELDAARHAAVPGGNA